MVNEFVLVRGFCLKPCEQDFEMTLQVCPTGGVVYSGCGCDGHYLGGRLLRAGKVTRAEALAILAEHRAILRQEITERNDQLTRILEEMGEE